MKDNQHNSNSTESDKAAVYSRVANEKQDSSTTTWYFPLVVKMLADDMRNMDYDMDDYDTISPREAVYYKDAILEQIEKENSWFDTPRMLAEYFSDDDIHLNDRVYCMTPMVEEVNGKLWGAMSMRLTGNLTPEDTRKLKEYITGQNSDGYGEGLEQREIRVPDGELYVSFWHSGKDYAVYTQEEFVALPENIQAESPLQRKPNCPIIGADGNIFNIMGIAARTLKENGMAEAAKEMRSRVTESGSYDNALAIIMEYVTPVSAEGHGQSGMEMRM